MKKKNILWKLLLFLGIVPFLIAIIFSAYKGITGFSFFCIPGCKPKTGFATFFDVMLLYSSLFWPTYIIGIAAMAVSIVELKKGKKKCQKK